jgi:hypothetical protein
MTVIPELYIEKIIIKYYPIIIITEPRIFIRIKLIIFIDTFYILIKNKKDIKIKNV